MCAKNTICLWQTASRSVGKASEFVRLVNCAHEIILHILRECVLETKKKNALAIATLLFISLRRLYNGWQKDNALSTRIKLESPTFMAKHIFHSFILCRYGRQWVHWMKIETGKTARVCCSLVVICECICKHFTSTFITRKGKKIGSQRFDGLSECNFPITRSKYMRRVC